MFSHFSLYPKQKDDANMNEIIHQAHRFLQNFCRGNPANQKLLHENLSLFMQSGENVSPVGRMCKGVSRSTATARTGNLSSLSPF